MAASFTKANSFVAPYSSLHTDGWQQFREVLPNGRSTLVRFGADSIAFAAAEAQETFSDDGLLGTMTRKVIRGPNTDNHKEGTQKLVWPAETTPTLAEECDRAVRLVADCHLPRGHEPILGSLG